jgi:hypothetical protein
MHAIGYNSHIGPKFLKASVGFGGPCFQKGILESQLGVFEQIWNDLSEASPLIPIESSMSSMVVLVLFLVLITFIS